MEDPNNLGTYTRNCDTFDSYNELQKFLIKLTHSVGTSPTMYTLEEFNHAYNSILIASFDAETGQQTDLFRMIHSPIFKQLQERLVECNRIKRYYNRRLN